MFWPKRDREKDRYYLLPGQGGRALRQKQKFILAWSLVVALAVAGIMALVMYLLNRLSLP